MRSKCHKIKRFVSDYIDGTLPERQSTDIASHIRSCRSCRREVADVKKTQHLLKNFYIEPEASDTYYARFTRQLQQRIEQTAPTALHQRIAAAAAHFAWRLLTQVYRYTDRFRPSRFISIRPHALPYYVLTLTMTVLITTPFLLPRVSLHDSGERAHFKSTVEPTVTLAFQQDSTAGQSIGIRLNLNRERTTETPAIDSDSDIWEFTNEPMTDGHIFATLRTESAGMVPNVALDIDSELLTYAEFPAQGAISVRLTSRDVPTNRRYASLLLHGINTEQHAHQQYQRNRSEFEGFSEKLLDVPLEMISVAAVYDPIEL